MEQEIPMTPRCPAGMHAFAARLGDPQRNEPPVVVACSACGLTKGDLERDLDSAEQVERSILVRFQPAGVQVPPQFQPPPPPPPPQPWWDGYQWRYDAQAAPRPHRRSDCPAA